MKAFTIASAVLAVFLLGNLRAASLEDLRAREAKVKAVVAKALPSVVAVIGTTQNGDAPAQTATGSGVIVSEDGLIMTAGHVTDAAGSDLMIIFPDGRSAKGKSLGANRSRDAGLAKITDEGKWPFVEIGDSDKAQLGDWVVAMGHPGGFELTRTPPVRIGRIVGKGEMGMLSTDCTLVGGDSGGPLFDLDGKVIGIHSSIGGSLAENRHVPSSVYKHDWERMVAGEVWGTLALMAAGVDPDRPMLGIQMEQGNRRVVVKRVMPHSPALKAGILDGDVIVKVDGIAAEQVSDVVDQVSSLKAGDEVDIHVRRGDEEKNFKVTLVRWEDLAGGSGGDSPEARPEPASGRPQLGVILDNEAEAPGATVHEVMADSPAARGGVQAGDVVFELDGGGIGSATQMAERMQDYKPGDEIELKVRRGEAEEALKVLLGER